MMFTLYTGTQQERGDIHSYPYTVTVKSIEDLIEATRQDHTPGIFEGKNRDFENFIGADCILGDIDNAGIIEEYWITLDIIKETFKDYAFALTPSRNHMKEKKGESPRPKFHLYFPVPFHESAEKQERYMTLLHERFEELRFDPNVKDAARCFFGHNDKHTPELFYLQDGKPISTAFGGRPKGTGKPKVIPWRDMSLDELAVNPEIVPIGERYEVHKILSMHQANKGLNADEIEAWLIGFNALMPEPRAIHQKNVQVQTRKLAESAAGKIKKEGGANPDFAYKMIRNFYVVKGDRGPVRVAVRSTTKEMKTATGAFVVLVSQNGSGTLTLKDNPETIITKTAQLSATLESMGYIWDVRGIAGAMTKDEILARFQMLSQKIHRMTCVPEDGIKSTTLLVPQITFPDAKKTGAFREFLDVFSFKTPGDQYRFAAGVLSLYLSEEYDGKIPMFALLADAQNAGKTTVVRTAVKLVTGMDALEQKGGKFNQADDNAQFGGVLGLAARGVLYDNLTNLNTEAEVEISRAITDTNRAAWNMGISRGHIRNSFVYFATFNDTEGFGRDLQERIIVIRMMDPDDVSRVQREQIMDNLEHWKSRRDEVISDIRHLIGITKEIDYQETNPKQKYVEWTRRISPALKEMYPEVKYFDFSSEREDHKIDPIANIVSDTLQDILITNMDKITMDQQGEYSITYSAKELFQMFHVVNEEYARSFSPVQFSRMISAYKKVIGGISLSKGQGTVGLKRGRMFYKLSVSKETMDELKKVAKESIF